VKSLTRTRRAVLVACLTGTSLTATTGCTGNSFSLASVNPFAGGRATDVGAGPASSPRESLAKTSSGPQSQLASFGTKAKDAVSKTTRSVTGFFTGGVDPVTGDGVADDDPLRLDNKPERLDPEIFVANGHLFESAGNFAKAMESYTKALEQESNYGPALSSIARLHFRQGNHPQAADYFQKAVAQQPDNAELYHDLGLTQSKLGQHQPAIENLTRAVQISPGNSRFANNLASVQFDAGNQPAAYQVLRENNEPAVAHFNMAYLHFSDGQLNHAREHLNEALKFEPLAESDSAVKRAVDRSKEMLAQIERSKASTSQATAGTNGQGEAAATEPMRTAGVAAGVPATGQSNLPTVGGSIETRPGSSDQNIDAAAAPSVPPSMRMPRGNGLGLPPGSRSPVSTGGSSLPAGQ